MHDTDTTRPTPTICNTRCVRLRGAVARTLSKP